MKVVAEIYSSVLLLLFYYFIIIIIIIIIVIIIISGSGSGGGSDSSCGDVKTHTKETQQQTKQTNVIILKQTNNTNTYKF